jgi:hypothetical protein
MIKNDTEIQAFINSAVRETADRKGKTENLMSFEAGMLSGMKTMATLLGHSGKFYWHAGEEVKEGNA